MRWLLVAISFCGAVCAVMALTVADEAEKPSLKVLTNLHGPLISNVDETKAIYCEGRNLKQKLEWISPSGEPVGRKSSNKRIHAEHRVNQTYLLGLFLKNLTIKDGGNWTCRSGDELSQTITLYVGEKVNMTVKEMTVVGDEGKSIKLVCDAKGFPEPVIQWYRDNVIIEADSSKYIIKQKRDSQYTLEITNLSHLDPGIYTCRATQEKISHFDQKLFHLNVRHKPIIINDEFSEREVYAIMNEIKNITCRAQANPLPKFSWAKRSKDRFDHLIEDDQVYMAEDGTYSVLMLKVFKEDDLGQYKCSVENDRGRENIIFDVSLGNKPDPPTSVTAVNINAFNITFNVTCETCIFSVDDDMATNPKNLTVLGYNFQLVPCREDIAVPVWENATNFLVNVDNTTVLSQMVADEAGKTSLKVLTNQHGPLMAYVNETRTIFCEISGEGRYLKQKLEWISPSGEPVATKLSNNIIYAEHPVKQNYRLGLFLKKLAIKDGGNWTCRSGDELIQTITLYVGEKVNMTVKEMTVVGDEGKSIKLVCDAKGFPEPLIQWYRDNSTIIDADPNKYIIKNHKEHTLEIINLSHLDPGIYTCKATQEKLSHFDEKLFHLNVRHKPIIDFNEYTKTKVYAIMNEIKNITCRARANPLPKFSWARHGADHFEQLIADDHCDQKVYMAGDGTYSVLTLKVHKEDDQRQYKCSVENDMGRETIIFVVLLGNKPNPPTSVEAVNIKAFNITFNITCRTCIFNVEGVTTNPSNLTVLGYNFQLVPYQEGIAVPHWENATEFIFNVDNTTGTLFTVTPLMNGTAYHTRVATRNAAGLSDWLPVYPNPKTLEKNDVAALTVSLALLIIAFFTTRCY